MNDFIAKPFKQAELYAVLARAGCLFRTLPASHILSYPQAIDRLGMWNLS
jgi:FixJ family two-component response regulator